MRSTLRLTSLISLFLLLTGCGLFSTKNKPEMPSSPLDWKAQQEKIAELQTWQLDGKIGMKIGKDSGSATLFWLQQLDYYDIRLSGPLGRGATRIIGKKGDVSIEIAGQGRYTASTPEELLQQQLGWNIPISHLVWWIKGLPAPSTPYTYNLNESHLLQDLTQDNWTIHYQDYQNYAGYWLPERIIATTQDIRITLVIKQWTLRKMGQEIASN